MAHFICGIYKHTNRKIISKLLLTALIINFVTYIGLCGIVSYAAASAVTLKSTVSKVYNDSKTTADQKEDIQNILSSNADGASVEASQQVTITLSGNQYVYAANGSGATSANTSIQSIYDSNHATDSTKNNDTETVNKGIKSITQNFNVSADIDGATDSMQGFLPLLKTITGVMTVVIIFGLLLFTGLDMCYMAFPTFQSKTNDTAQRAAANGNSLIANTSKTTGEAKCRWITDDAIFAVEQSASTGKQPYLIYLKRRTGTYIGVTIVIYLLMSGNMAIFLNIILKLLAGVIDNISSYATIE